MIFFLFECGDVRYFCVNLFNFLFYYGVFFYFGEKKESKGTLISRCDGAPI